MMTDPAQLYNDAFFHICDQEAAQSADAIVPSLVSVTRAETVVDIGCGRGAWLAAFKRCGVQHVLGVDGPHISTDKLVIGKDEFRTCDLAKQDGKPIGSFDLAICLEVAEHLPLSAARPLIDCLTRSARFVLFSAAVPGQGGTGHINEQWPEFWERQFTERGFCVLRGWCESIWTDTRISWYYRQNMRLFVERQLISTTEDVAGLLEARNPNLTVISPAVIGNFKGVRGLARELVYAVARSVKRRLSGY